MSAKLQARMDALNEKAKEIEGRIARWKARNPGRSWPPKKKSEAATKAQEQQVLQAKAMENFSEEYKERVQGSTMKGEVNMEMKLNGKPFIGFGLAEVEDHLIVDSVWRDSGAHQQGLKPGDRIWSLGGSAVATLDDFRGAYKESCTVGEFVNLMVTRIGEKGKISIPVWVMTSEEKYRGEHEFFDVAKSEKLMDTNSMTVKYQEEVAAEEAAWAAEDAAAENQE